MLNDDYSWLKLSYGRIKVILVYYCIILLLGTVISLLVLIPVSQNPINKSILDISTLGIYGSLGISAVGSATYYIRKIYKSCIQGIIRNPEEKNELDKLQQLGVTVYYIIRPIFALGFSLLVIIGIKAGVLTMAKENTNLSEGFIYLCMFISFFCGFSSGDLLKILEQSGNKIFNKLFDNEN